MVSGKNFQELSFLVYGLGLTGQSVVKFFKRNKIKNYKVWDDTKKNLYKKKRPINLNKTLKEINYIVLSPGVSLKKTINRNKLNKHKKKIITDIDLIFLFKKFSKTIVVTGTNGKSTTCKILSHVLQKNGYKCLLGGNIGTPVLDLDIKSNNYLVIEASSFQLAHSKFIKPDYAFLLNISNDHLDWHGNMEHYINSKFKIFKNQRKDQYAFLNKKFKNVFNKKNCLGKLIIPNLKSYKKIKFKNKNSYLSFDINDENMSYVYSFIKELKISDKSFFNSLKTFVGLSHRYEIFLKKKNYIFINDSKATTFQATKFALENSNNIFWILGGLPKKNDKINIKKLKNKIIKTYIIGSNVNFFKKQLKNKIEYEVTHNLKNSILKILKDIKIFKRQNYNILLSPASASYDQFLNFEKRGEQFKKLSLFYARKYI